MTSPANNSSTPTATPSASDDLWPEASEQEMQEYERVRQRSVAEFSYSPLYQAMAAKDPEYWNTFYVGRAR